MLTELRIDSLRTIERAELVLGPGMTVLTGETGAGKTMIVDAIALLLGGRADPSMVRPGAVQATVWGRFVVDDSEHVLSRVVPLEGRSRAYHNDQPVTATRLAELAGGWIELHGQSSHQRLTTTAEQRSALDRAGAIDVTEYELVRAEIAELTRRRDQLGGDDRARARQLDLLRFQDDELAQAQISDPDEERQLADEADELEHVEAAQQVAAEIIELLSGDDGVVDRLGGAAQRTGALRALADAGARLRAAQSELIELARELRGRADSAEIDQARIAAVRERRQLLRDLRRKYGESLDDVLAFHDEVRRRLAEVESSDQVREQLGAQIEVLSQRRDALAETVFAARLRAARTLAPTLQDRLRVLALPHASIGIEVAAPAPGEHVTFLLAANPGLPPAPLAASASGGELSRAMLALRLVLATDVDTLIFDEVDAGIGGAAADAVGAALADLATRRQVLVVTHLAQVAARADHQVRIVKSVRDGIATTVIEVVDGAARITEVARLLDGRGDRISREHAQQLLDELGPRRASAAPRRGATGRHRPTT